MKKFLASVCGGAALVALFAGCDPQLAEIESGSEEAVWAKQLRANYRSWNPPRHPAPAAYNAPNWNNARQSGTALPAEDPENAVDRAADGKNVRPVPAVEEIKTDDPKKTDGEGKTPVTPALPEPEVKPAADDSKAQTPAQAQPPAQAEETASRIYIVQSNDTLGGIAKKFYGKASLDDVIFRANSKVLKDRNSLSIGMRLVIPEL